MSQFLLILGIVLKCHDLVLQRGHNHPCVGHLQHDLNDIYGYQLSVDSIFGPLTESAVRDFQTNQGINSDGIVGPITWGEIHPDMGGNEESNDPKGVVDINNGDIIEGWSFDPNDSNASNEVHIYIYGSGKEAIGYNTGLTSVDRSDVNTVYGIGGIHGFAFSVPSEWCDGKNYTADVFGINIGSGNNSIIGSDSWSCKNGQSKNPDDVNNQGKIQANIAVEFEGVGPNAQVKVKQEMARVKIFDINSKDGSTAKYSSQDFLTYQSASGNFVNPKFNLGKILPGEYKMVIQVDKYLDKQLTGPDGSLAISIGQGREIGIGKVEMQAGDVAPAPGGDNSIDIIDYNALIGCMPSAQRGSCLNKDHADLNRDGKVDQIDLGILQRNFSQKGFVIEMEEYKCEANPACESGKETLQMCSLLCSKKTKRS